MALGTGPLTTTDASTQSGAGEEIREIEAAAPPARFARGWHCLGLSNTYRDGQPHQIEAFGTSLVVFADSKGDIKILDAYCRHMGGNLAHGTVKGDSIACPFH
ncbi:Rieske 2Fe-2S domain-containing protein, partial [Rhodococcus erythropolis]|nr:Rieske 2Fe-2S domain-containing protein [Rhodococcus erythropolis]